MTQRANDNASAVSASLHLKIAKKVDLKRSEQTVPSLKNTMPHQLAIIH